MASTYTPIATTTISGTSTSSVTFSSIPSTYTDLVLVIVAGLSGGVDGGLGLQTGNGSVNTGSVYSTTYLYGTGSSAASARDTSATSAHPGRIDANPSTSIIQIMNYSNATTNKTILSRGNDNTLTMATVSLVRDTSAINVIKVSSGDPVSYNFTNGSTFTLYGITAA